MIWAVPGRGHLEDRRVIYFHLDAASDQRDGGLWAAKASPGEVQAHFVISRITAGTKSH